MLWMKSAAIALLCCLGFGGLSTLAEESAPTEVARPYLVSVLTIEVKPGTQSLFENFVGKYKAAADKVKGVPSWFASSPGIGSNTTYTFAQPFGSFAELFQDRNILTEVYDEAEIADIMGMARASMVKSSSAVYMHRGDLSRSFPASDKPPVITLFIGFRVREGKSAAFENYVKKIVEATDKVAPDLHWESYAGVFAADLDYGVRVPMWNAAELDTVPMGIQERLVKAFGKREGDRIYDAGQATIADQQNGISRVRTDLSHVNSAE